MERASPIVIRGSRRGGWCRKRCLTFTLILTVVCLDMLGMFAPYPIYGSFLSTLFRWTRRSLDASTGLTTWTSNFLIGIGRWRGGVGRPGFCRTIRSRAIRTGQYNGRGGYWQPNWLDRFRDVLLRTVRLHRSLAEFRDRKKHCGVQIVDGERGRRALGRRYGLRRAIEPACVATLLLILPAALRPGRDI